MPNRSGPAEAGRLDRRLQRAGGQAGLGRLLGVVVAAGGDVVGGVGVEDRGQVLDLAAALAELGLAAAVGADPALLAVVVGGEEVARSAPKREGLTLTVFGGDQGIASMSAIEWIGASQVTRSETGSRIGRVSSLTSGSSSQASGKASISFA